MSCCLFEFPVESSEGKLLEPCCVQVFCIICCKSKLPGRRYDMPHGDWVCAFIDGLSDYNFQILQGGRDVGRGENASSFRDYKSICDFEAPN